MYKYYILILSVFIVINAQAQIDTTYNQYIDNGLISLADKDGFSWSTARGDFLFKPYTLIQTRAIGNYFDDEGLSLSEQDNIFNSGFEIPFALVGFAGRAFDIITYNVTINAATSGAALLNQAWFDINASKGLRFRVGKFKTPFNQAFLVRNGQTLFPVLPTSLTTRINLPYDINSVNPVLATGFDIGVQMHGLLQDKISYQIGVFNGTGITVNTATNGLSDDNGLPSLLYAGRLAVMPFGNMPQHQGDPFKRNETKLLLALSGSYNVEANYESSNDLRAGFELAFLCNGFYASAEGYMLSMDFVERQQNSPVYTFWGGYAQLGYFVTKKLQPAIRFDVMDRNAIDTDGILYFPSMGINYYLAGHNLKLQAMYQFMGKSGHESTFDANDDDNSIPEHKAILQLQFAF